MEGERCGLEIKQEEVELKIEKKKKEKRDQRIKKRE